MGRPPVVTTTNISGSFGAPQQPGTGGAGTAAINLAGRRTEKGKAYGAITAKALAVLEALLWGFHNARSGLCFPSYATIAERAGCARSTVAEALKALEDAGLLTWVNRIVRIRGHHTICSKLHVNRVGWFPRSFAAGRGWLGTGPH
jgi:AraC-like DNA-binding protein